MHEKPAGPQKNVSEISLNGLWFVLSVAASAEKLATWLVSSYPFQLLAYSFLAIAR